MLKDLAFRAAADNVIRNKLDANPRAVAQHHGAFNHVFQFADVSGPAVIHQGPECLRRNLDGRLAVFAGKFFQKMTDKAGNVFTTAAQRRQINRNHVQAIVKVFAELAFAHQHVQINVGGRDQANIDLQFMDAAQMHELAVLDHAQNLRLGFKAHGADLIQEDGAAIGHFKQAFF